MITMQDGWSNPEREILLLYIGAKHDFFLLGYPLLETPTTHIN
jgi:hypothetical protein